MPVLQALKDFNYDHTRVSKGSLFKCKGKHVHLVVGSGLAKVPTEMVHTPTGIEPDVRAQTHHQEYQTRQMEASTPDYSKHTKAKLQGMLDDRRIKWSQWENKAVLIDRLKANT
jgi:hypothetical protein